MPWDRILLFALLAIMPLISIAVQWRLIFRQKPWIARSAGLLIIILIWLFISILIFPSSAECSINPLSCEWTGFARFLVTVYSIFITGISLLVGAFIHRYYRNQEWESDEIISERGKIVYFLLLVMSLLAVIWFIINYRQLFSLFTLIR